MKTGRIKPHVQPVRLNPPEKDGKEKKPVGKPHSGTAQEETEKPAGNDTQ